MIGLHRAMLVAMLLIILSLGLNTDLPVETTNKLIIMFMAFGAIFIITPREKDRND